MKEEKEIVVAGTYWHLGAQPNCGIYRIELKVASDAVVGTVAVAVILEVRYRHTPVAVVLALIPNLIIVHKVLIFYQLEAIYKPKKFPNQC